MGFCKDCKYWSVWSEGSCDKAGDDYADKDAFVEIDYDALDDTGLSLYLKTGPEFGCVLFKKKEAKN